MVDKKFIEYIQLLEDVCCLNYEECEALEKKLNITIERERPYKQMELWKD